MKRLMMVMMLGLLTGCETSITAIVNVDSVVGKTVGEVENTLGKVDKIEKIKGYPCQLSLCTKVWFGNGKYDAIFRDGKLCYLTIYKVQDLTTTDNPLPYLGLKTAEPSFWNSGTVVRFNDVYNYHEIAFFTDFIAIQVTPSDKQ